MQRTSIETGTTAGLAAFVSQLLYRDIPREVVERTKDLFLDWLASALAGREARPVAALERFARTMGPQRGFSELLTNRARTSAHFGAMVNAASSHVVEQDDVHNGSVFHPAAVVFPAALAVAQETGATGRDFLSACVAGYEVGVRVGEFLGRSHYTVFHTTGTAGTLASAAAVSRLLDLSREKTLHALGSAGTQAAGLWEFLGDAADSKQLHTAKAASDGLLSAYLARNGLTGAKCILEGRQGMAAGMSTDADPSRLSDGLGRRWAVLETSFKFHASCRHTHPAADALLAGIEEHALAPGDIRRVTARVHRGAVDVLGSVKDPRTVHQSKFSMGFVLALIAVYGRASIVDFTEAALKDRELRLFHDRVEMIVDEEVDAAYPKCWIGLVDIETADGEVVTARVDVPKGDPQNTLSRNEIEEKTARLAAFGNGATEEEVKKIIARAWNLENEENVRDLLPAGGTPATG